ncbi:MAG: ATP-dependent Clp protease ATP-binding subunit ClpX [Lachnospiraceae bacterium]|nr:ATP-dependent Clp protease ATP-binding subunit ClpX [Lachnospiraceae bacterium]
MADEINNNNFDNNNDEREHVCYMCHRTESRAGKMLRMPGNMYVCVDCIQRTIDSIGSSGFDLDNLGFGGMPPFMGMPFGGNPAPEEIPNAPEQEVLTGEVINEDGEVETPGENKTEKQEPPKRGIPNISFINLSDLQQGFGKRQQIKKKTERTGPLVDPDKVLPPHKLKEKLDEYVVGQERAKKAISVAVYNHYKRILAGDKIDNSDGVEIEKSNMLLIGPTGCGKTYIVKTLAKMLDVPLAITDATSLTEAGYIGDDIESVLSKLLAAADNDVERAEIGIVFIDEIDKIAKKNSNRGRDVSGESVQQGLLKLLEGSEVEVPVGASSKNAMVPLATINTKNILFICGGAFPELEDIIRNRLRENSSIGFNAELKDKYDDDKNILDHVEMEDLRGFGMIPEFLGRLPMIVTLQGLTGEMLVKVLKEPKNAILKQYQKLLELDEVKLEFEDDALLVLTERAAKRQIGARGLRSIIEEIMLDIMYEIPKDDSIGKVIITKDYIENHGSPRIELRG